MHLGPTLKKIMKEKRLTFKRLSERTGIPETTLKGWCAGVAARNFRLIKTLSNELGCSFEFLCLGEDPPIPPTLEDVLNMLSTEKIYEGWVKVAIAKPSIKKKPKKKGDNNE